MTISTVLIACLWFIFLIVWVVSAASAKKSTTSSFGWFVARVALLVALLVVFHTKIFGWLAMLSGPELPANPLLSIVGVILAALGIGFAIWARVHLGRNWGMPMTIKTEPELVTSGPYAFVRHPIYTGVLLAVLGSVFASGLAWLVMFVVVGAYFIYAALREEKVMAATFPNQYPVYKARTKMLIPFIL